MLAIRAITKRSKMKLVGKPDAGNRHVRFDAKLTKSIARFGFLVPCIIDDDDRVLAGNARVAAAARLGFTEVPAIRIRHLTEAEMRAFVVADNKLTELATWNDAILREELQFFAELDIDFDFSAIGFETAEVDIILGDATGSKDDDLTVLRSGRPAVSRLGDLWVAGLHHIYCGDALVPGSYKQLLESVRKHQAGLQSFRSMRRIEARRRKASALRLRFSQSLASLRQRLSQAKVRSTIQRRGSTTNPLVRSERLTISVSS